MGIRKKLIQGESEARRFLRRIHPAQRKSAYNLVHYLALRRIDLRSLQPRLTARGLSSLGRSEAHVMANLDAAAHGGAHQNKKQSMLR
jgi:pyruvate kinase